MATNIFTTFFFFFFFFFLSLWQVLDSSPATVGKWRFLQRSIGISAMHMQLLHNNKVVIFDRTDFGLSNISLPRGRRCPHNPNGSVLKTDCSAHSVLYDIDRNSFRPLMVQTNTWCSSGAVLPDGTLVQTGGTDDGDRVVRRFAPRDDCDWVEFPRYLTQHRWYATDQILPDGRIFIIGGRGQFNYEFYPKNHRDFSSSGTFWIQFLRETSDENENKLYPFVHRLPDGNLFLFANTRCILFDYNRNRVVREFPSIPGGEPRNQPSTVSSVLLPIDENGPIQAKIMVCGGAPHESASTALRGVFMRASSTCGRLRVTDDNPEWRMQTMPMPRVMGDMLLLPDGNVLIINGAGSGVGGWGNARNPVTRPLLYIPCGPNSDRFLPMEASARPRLYHSTAILLTDGRVLVGGSNPNPGYNFTGVMFPTDLSLEAFHPPYLAARHDFSRPRIVIINQNLRYGQSFSVTFTVAKFHRPGVVSVRIIAPSFATHSFSMNQRMVVLKKLEVSFVTTNTYVVTAVGPSKPEIAPPGYYMLFVVQAGIPSPGVWVKIQR